MAKKKKSNGEDLEQVPPYIAGYAAAGMIQHIARMTGTELKALIIAETYNNHKSTACFPTHETMTQDANVSRKVPKDGIRGLERLGIITQRRRGVNKSNYIYLAMIDVDGYILGYRYYDSENDEYTMIGPRWAKVDDETLLWFKWLPPEEEARKQRYIESKKSEELKSGASAPKEIKSNSTGYEELHSSYEELNNNPSSVVPKMEDTAVSKTGNTAFPKMRNTAVPKTGKHNDTRYNGTKNVSVQRSTPWRASW
jgi:hypothetical protein